VRTSHISRARSDNLPAVLSLYCACAIVRAEKHNMFRMIVAYFAVLCVGLLLATVRWISDVREEAHPLPSHQPSHAISLWGCASGRTCLLDRSCSHPLPSTPGFCAAA